MTAALVGRSTELSMLQAFCRRLHTAGGSLLLRGEPGVGKTALLGAIAQWAGAEGFQVLRADAVRAEAVTDCSLLNQLLLPLEGWLTRLVPHDQQVLSEALGFVEGPSGDCWAIAAAALALLRLAAADHPVLLVIDDLQWADRASAEVLELLVCCLDQGGIGLLGASRSHDAGFFDSRLLPCTRVLPLAPAAASELVTRNFPELDRRELPALLARSGGNPLALLELPRVLGTGRSDLPHPPAATWSLSPRVKHAFTADLQELPVETRRLLLLLALDGTGDLSLFDGATPPSELRPADQVGLVSSHAGTRRLTFTHPLIAFAIIGLATSDDRRTAHQELARLLAGRPDRQAPHLADAATGPDEGVAAQLESAGADLARRGDAAAAVTIYRRSASLSEDSATRARRIARAAYISVTIGDLRTGQNLLEEATRSDPTVCSSLTYAMAVSAATLHGLGDVDAAHRGLMNAFRSHLAHREVDRGTLVGAMQELLQLCLWTQRPDHWSSLRTVLTELDSGDDVVLRIQVATLVHPLPGPKDPFEESVAELDQLLSEVDQTSLTRLAECALQAGRFAHYRDRLDAVVADGRNRDGTAAAIDALCCLARDAFSTGDWDRAKHSVDQGLAWGDRLGYQRRVWTLRWIEALIDAARGGIPAVRQSTDEMLQWAEQHGIGSVRNYAHHVRALAALSSGKFELAYQEASAVAPAGSLPPPGSETPDLALCMVEAALHTFRGEEAARQAGVLRERYAGATSSRVGWVVAAAAAMAAPDPDRGRLFERALGEHGFARDPFDLARVHLAYGQHLRRCRATGMARVHLRTALEIFERLNAWPWVERTRIELDASGETRNQVEPGLVLTPQERTVALLAASGHTNKQIAEKLFLTHRTVAAHLHQVFRKLGVNSRAALRDALDLEAVDPPAQRLFLSQRPLEPDRDDRGPTPRQPVSCSLATR